MPNHKYIPLAEAAKYCSYSADYLKLRARQGKLKAVKIGRIWVTKKEWVKEYVREMERYKKERRAKKTKLQTSSSSLKWKLKIPSSFVKTAPVVLAIIFITTGIVFGKETLYPFYEKVVATVQQIPELLVDTTELTKEVYDDFSTTSRKLSSFVKEIGEVTKTQIQKTSQDISLGFLSFKKEIKDLTNEMAQAYVFYKGRRNLQFPF